MLGSCDTCWCRRRAAKAMALEEGGALAGCRTAGHDSMRDALESVLRQAGYRPHREPVGLVPGTAQRPADVLLSGVQAHGLGRTAQQQQLDCCIDVVGVHSLSPSYVHRPDLLQPLREAKAVKERRQGLPSELFVIVGVRFHIPGVS